MSIEKVRGGHAERLYAVAQALTAALTPDDVAAAIFERALSDLGASTTGLWLLDGDTISFAGGAGHVGDSPERVGAIPLDSDLPAAVCVRARDVVAYGSLAERNARWPSLADLRTTSEAIAVLPLSVEDRILGCLHIGYPTPMAAEDMEIPLLWRLAELCAAALDRAQLYERERASREQLEFFSDATRVLIRSLDPADVVQALVDTAVPRLAEWCAVLTPHGDHLRTVAVRMTTSAPELLRAVTEERFPIGGDFLVSQCYRTRRPQIADPIPSSLEVAPPTNDAVNTAGIRSAMLVPIEWAGQPIGVLSLGFAREGRTADKRLIETAEGLALRAGVALHNARMYDAERTVARTLTEALLPGRIPQVPGYEVAADYLPAGGDVAGDWYDLLDLGGRFLVGVGDAAGHGIPAATLMAELRNAARGLAAGGAAPAALLDGLVALVEDAEDAFATALYGILDPVAHDLVWSRAGHPAPILLRGGEATTVDAVTEGPVEGPPLAPGVGPGRTEHHLRLEPGDTVVMFTDGVVERRDADLDDGLERLRALVGSSDGLAGGVLAERIVRELCATAADDCCVLVVRRVG